MGGTVMPCGCILEWGGPELQAIFCFRHTEEYVEWRGSEIDFLKRIATPQKQKNKRQIMKYNKKTARQYA